MIVEPVQGRVGSRVPPPGFLAVLRERCDAAGALLIVDAIFTGLGRLGEMWPGEDIADVLCVGKALGGGLPLSAALFVRIDMEDSSTTDETLQLYRDLRASGHENVGVVLQATLRRTLSDIRELTDLQPSVRLCKGIYIEPPEIAYRDFGAVRANYVRSLEALLDAGCYVGIATHDEWLVAEGRRLVAERELDREEYEFQMLLGVRPDLGNRLVREGHRLRVYVPFGRHWYEYSMRRLQENPKIAGYIAADTIGRFVPGRRNGA